MKKVTFVWLLIILLLQAQGATVALPVYGKRDTVGQHKEPLQQIMKLTTVKKPNIMQKAVLRAVERKVARQLKKGEDGNLREKRILGMISMLSSIVGIITLFTVPIVGICLVPIALTTGILGVSNNNDKRSRAQSIVGIVFGGLGFALAILALILIAAWGG